jgi:hypothetical protein
VELPSSTEKILSDVLREDVDWVSHSGSAGRLIVDVRQRRAYAEVSYYELVGAPTQELTVEQATVPDVGQ